MNSESTDKATAIWDQRYEDSELACTKKVPSVDPIDYTQHPFLYENAIAKRLTGGEKGNPIHMIGQKFLTPPAKKMLAVGSGLATIEEYLVKEGFVENLLAFESSSVAVENVRQRVKESGLGNRIEMVCGDVLDANLPENEFDVVFVQAAIHHFYNIEEMFELFHKLLKPNGLLIYDEYVGPDHHMYEPEVMQLMNEVNDCLSENFRWDVLRKEIREEVPVATLEWMLEMDPSEGVHSTQILPLTYKYFNVELRKDYGGTFMRPFFVGILPNFDFTNEKDQTIARLIILLEELLIRYGVIPTYHSIIVGRKLDNPIKITPSEADRINYSDWEGFKKFRGSSAPPKLVKFTTANYSDRNWENGVAKWGEAVVFLPATEQARFYLKAGQEVVFSNTETRTIENVKEENESLVVKFTGNQFDASAVGYPKKFAVAWIQK